VDENLSELERLEAAKKWWLENYKSMLSGALIAVVVVGGWRYWQHRTESRSQAAEALYQDLSDDIAKHDADSALKTGGRVMKEYPDTPYATLAAFKLAQVQADAGRTKEAGQILEWVMQHSKDDGLKMMARLRLAGLKLASNDAQGALDTLDVPDASGFAPLYDAARGDAYAKLGKTEEARAAYGKALAAWTDALGDRSLIQMKLDGLPAKAQKP
jgi:predicted negative regulator of RcsB-dependent stress response